MRRFVEVDVAIGDSLMITPALRAHRSQRPEVEIVLVAPWDGLTETVLRGNPSVGRFMPKELALAARRPRDEWTTLSPRDALQWGIAQQRPMMDGFAGGLGVRIPSPEGYRLDLVLTEKERAAGTALRETLGSREKVIVCARHSPSCSSNGPRGTPPNKCFPNAIWVEAAEWLIEQGYVPVAVGSQSDAHDPRYREWPGPRVYGESLRMVAGMIADCRAVFCVDTGLRFVAAALGTDLACLSGHIPTWLVYAPPSRTGQRIVEAYRAVEAIDGDRCRRLLREVLEPSATKAVS